MSLEPNFLQEKNKSVDLLLDIRETATLQEIINLCSEKQAEMDLGGKFTEYEFCEYQGRIQVLEEIKNYCKEKINKLKENQ